MMSDMSIEDMRAVVRWHEWRLKRLREEFEIEGRESIYYVVRAELIDEIERQLKNSRAYLASLEG